MVPKRLRAIKMQPPKKAPKQYSAATKISLAVVMCVILCLLFPVAAPLFFSLFIGIVIKESGLKHVCDFISGPMLYGSTFFLGILLGILCDAHTLLDPTVLKLLVLGILALLISGIGGILGGYAMYFLKRGNFNPVIGIAAVSCVPTTAKVAQKIVSHDNPTSFVLADVLGANIGHYRRDLRDRRPAAVKSDETPTSSIFIREAGPDFGPRLFHPTDSRKNRLPVRREKDDNPKIRRTTCRAQPSASRSLRLAKNREEERAADAP